MTITDTTIYCDTGGCKGEYRGAGSAGRVWKDARRNGWAKSHGGGIELCPKCVERRTDIAPEVGKSIAENYAGVQAVELAKEWFGAIVSTPPAMSGQQEP